MEFAGTPWLGHQYRDLDIDHRHCARRDSARADEVCDHQQVEMGRYNGRLCHGMNDILAWMASSTVVITNIL